MQNSVLGQEAVFLPVSINTVFPVFVSKVRVFLLSDIQNLQDEILYSGNSF